MSLYARSDLMSVVIPQPKGCGAAHTRPVTRGAPTKTWKLDCPQCESYLRGDGKGKVIKYLPGDKDKMIAPKMVHVADADPHWSNTPEGVPLTPDEQYIHKIREERAGQEFQQLQALAAAKAAGIEIPANAMWMLNQTFDPRIIKGVVLCPNGHDNVSGARFCAECGTGMSTKGAIGFEPIPPEPVDPADLIPLDKLHIATLRKKAREKGLNDKGTKAQLLERLSA